MGKFFIRRLGQAVVTLFAMSIIVFALARVSGDPLTAMLPIEATQETRDRVRAEWGLDQSLPMQYVEFISKAVRGDFGTSFRWPGKDALELVLERMVNTARLGAAALVFAFVVAIPLGVMSARHKNTIVDHFGKALAVLGQSLPHFWIGIMFVWVFAVQLRVLPVSGASTWRHYILPTIVIGWFQVAAIMRLVRSAMLESLDSEFVQLAQVKGVSAISIVWKHCLRNALIPPLTYSGIMLSYLIVGSITTEIVFAWPGIGALILDAVLARDYFVIQTVAMVLAAVVIAVNFVVDLLYAVVDPRIRYD